MVTKVDTNWTSYFTKYSNYLGQLQNSPLTRGAGFDNSGFTSGVQNPRWKRQCAVGINATTPFSWNFTNGGFHDMFAFYRFHTNNNPLLWQEYTLQGAPNTSPGLGLPSGISVPASVQTEVSNRAIRKFLDRLNDARSAFESGQDIGELHQTIESAIHPMNGLKNLTLSYCDRVAKIAARGRRKGPSVTKALADAYLEYRFGWRPLASDVADAISKIHQQQSVDVRRIEASATAQGTDIFVGAQSFAFAGRSLQILYKAYYKYTVRFIAGVRTGADTNGYRPLSQELQLDLPHFLPTVWDLIPYSFVVDYFTNIGDYLSGLSLRFSDVSWGCKTVSTESGYLFGPWHWGPNSVPQNQEELAVCYGGGGSWNNRRGTRSILTPSDLVPKLQFTLPFSSRPWENIGALILSRLHL